MYHLAPLMRFLLFCHVPMVLVYIVLQPSTWNMKRLQFLPRRSSELARTIAGMPRARAPAAAVLSRVRRVKRVWSRAEAMGVLPLRGSRLWQVGGRRRPPAPVVNPDARALSRASRGRHVSRS